MTTSTVIRTDPMVGLTDPLTLAAVAGPILFLTGQAIFPALPNDPFGAFPLMLQHRDQLMAGRLFTAAGGFLLVFAAIHYAHLVSPGRGALTDALRQMAVALATDDVRVQVSGEAGADLPAAVEVAAYRIAAEAVHDAVRHAQPTRIVVRLSRDPDLVVLVRDDGSGIGDLTHPGVGLASMRRRVEELGGSFVMESSSSGTTVCAQLPVRARPPEPPG